MEKVIDPAKARAEKAMQVCLQGGGNCGRQFLVVKKWSAIDMEFNEEIIEPVLLVKAHTYGYLGSGSEDVKQEVLKACDEINKNIASWLPKLDVQNREREELFARWQAAREAIVNVLEVADPGPRLK